MAEKIPSMRITRCIHLHDRVHVVTSSALIRKAPDWCLTKFSKWKHSIGILGEKTLFHQYKDIQVHSCTYKSIQSIHYSQQKKKQPHLHITQVLSQCTTDQTIQQKIKPNCYFLFPILVASSRVLLNPMYRSNHKQANHEMCHQRAVTLSNRSFDTSKH